MLEGLGVAVLLGQQHGEPLLRPPDAGPVAELGEELKRPPQVQVGRRVVAEPAAGVAEVVVHVGERVGVAEAVGRRQGRPLHREHLVHPAAPLQLRRPEPGQLPAVLVKPVRDGELEDAAQHPLLGPEPGQRRIVGPDRVGAAVAGARSRTPRR